MEIMKEKKHRNAERVFQNMIQGIADYEKFARFDTFLICRMGYSKSEITEEVRYAAYHKFRKLTARQEFASLPTMRRWFGIHGYAKPQREHIFMICFSLGASAGELREYLVNGIHESWIQFSDYHEVIYLYGIENGLKWEDALNMISWYERNIAAETVFLRTHTTNQLMEQYILQKDSDPNEFMEWMLSNASSFKGYSQTSLDYFTTYKDIIMKYICSDAQERLDSLLQETDFETWIYEKPFLSKKNRNEAVKKYIYYARRRKKNTISEDLLNNIRELNKIAGSETKTNQNVLSDLFSTSAQDLCLGNLTGKHLSDLLNLPLQMERSIRADKASAELHALPGDAKCPKWIQAFIMEYTKGRIKLFTVAAATEWIDTFRAEHHRRCRNINRQDILPMILYVAQHRYLEKIGGNMEQYEKDDARDLFSDLANATLSACGMTELSSEIQLDALLLAAFQEDEMFSYADIAEVLST